MNARKGAASRPTWTELHRLGSAMNKQLDHCCTLEELGKALGVTKQNAHHESVVALGKLVWHLRQRLGLPPL